MDLAPLAYQYGIGLLLLLLGIWAGVRNGVWGRGRWGWAWIMVAGWVLLLVVQGAMQIWAASG